MIVGLRRRTAHILARLAVRVDPDPALSFTTTAVRRISEPYPDLTQALADMISGHISGKGVAERKFTPGSGIDTTY